MKIVSNLIASSREREEMESIHSSYPSWTYDNGGRVLRISARAKDGDGRERGWNITLNSLEAFYLFEALSKNAVEILKEAVLKAAPGEGP